MNAPDSTGRLHLALERISSLFRAQLRERAGHHDLKLVQLEALIFLSVANRYSDTAGAVGEYLGITKGTASQTVAALVRRELITKVADVEDGRVQHCQLTAAGQAVVRDAYPMPLMTPSSHAGKMERAATELLRTLQEASDFRTFGQCHSCMHLQRGKGKRFRCGLTGETLSVGDTERLCRDHAESRTHQTNRRGHHPR